jgi:hypothetical protein
VLIPVEFLVNHRSIAWDDRAQEVTVSHIRMPGLCTGPFWSELFEIIQCLRGSLGTLMKAKMCRERPIALQQEKIPGSDWKWMHLKRDGIRQVLGFFIGETLVDPFAPTAAAATGPP